MARAIRRPPIARIVLVGLTGLVLLALPAVAATPGPSDDGSPTSASLRRGREAEELRRKDVVAELAARGVAASWQKQSLAELVDWRDRIDAARALGAQVGLAFDWRALSLAALTDMRLRAAKAADLRANFGIGVDWRRYTWSDLERLRLSLTALHPAPSPGVRGQTAWAADALAPFDPSRHVPKARPAVHDPDAIFEPLFASAVARNDAGHVRKGRRFHPDAVLAPTFGKTPLRSGEPDDLIDPWRPR